jgi:hypothetical protein
MSILYNLISNSIKYRSKERSPVIEVTSTEDEAYFILKVRDNGIGIDINYHKDHLFKLYKRFHQHIEGKGLGLYLVKLQAEALKGDVTVNSEINRFTEFTIRIEKPQNIERQVLYDESHAQIFFDAKLNATGVIWNGPLTSAQFRSVFSKCLEFVKVFGAPNYLADLSRQGPISREDQLWVFNVIMPDAVRNGLSRIAAVRPDLGDSAVREYLDGINVTLKKLGVIQQFFLNVDEASKWIQEQNENVSIS